MPVGKIVVVLLVIVGVVAALAAVYFLFLRPNPQQAKSLIQFARSLLH